MANFIIDPSSVSSTQIEADLVTFLKTQPDAARWSDFFESSVGTQIIKIIAGLGTFLEYNIIAARRETFLPYVVNRNSAVASSGTLGYSTYRGRNAVVSLTISPNISSLLPKYSIIGTVKDKDLILLEDTIFNAGVQNTFLAVVGNLLDETLTADTESLSSFRFSNNNMSSDVRVLLNDTEVSTSERILDLINQKFVIQSNVNGAVTVMYLNLDTFSIRYTIGDRITVQYVELSNLSFTLSNIICDIGTITTSSFSTVYQAVESIESIKINAPLFHETQYTIRGRDDYMKTFRLLDSSIVDTSYTDITPAVVELTYVTETLELYSASQLAQYMLQLSGYRPMGIEPPTVRHPRPVFLSLNISIKLLNNSGNPSSDVATIVSSIDKVLDQEVIFDDLEKQFEDLSFTKVARISITTTPWSAATTYVRGHHVTPISSNGKMYEMLDVVYKSGSTQPLFATGTSPFLDSTISWCEDVRVLCQDDGLPVWQPFTYYKDGDIVVAAPIFVTGTTSNANDTITGIITTNLVDGMLITGDNIQPNTYILSKTLTTVVMSKVATAAGSGIQFTFTLMKKFTACDFVNMSGSSEEIQQISFSPVPTSGTYRLEYDGDPTADLNYNSSALDLQNALNGLAGLGGFCSNPIYTTESDCLANGGTWTPGTGILVTGTYSTGFTINFGGADANKDQPELTLSDAGINEVQCVTFDFVPTSGFFTINFNGQTTALLPHNASIATITAGLENLSNIAPGEVSVSGNISPSKQINITFQNGLGKQDLPEITIPSNTLIAAITVSITPSTTTTGVAAFAGQNEIQQIAFSLIPTTGSFTLTYEFVTTSALNQTTTAASLQSALEALSSIGIGNVSVTGSFAAGFLVEFIGALVLTDRSVITVDTNTLGRAQNVSVIVTATQEGGGGFNEINKIDFNYVPNLGNWKLRSDGSNYSTSLISPVVSAATLQTYLESMFVTVPGDLSFVQINAAGDLTNLSATILNIVTGAITPGMVCSGTGIPSGSIVLSKTVNSVLLDQQASTTSAGVLLTFTDASDIVTNIVTTDVEVGTVVTGAGVPVSTTVLGKSLNTVTLSNKVTSSGLAVPLVFTRNNVGNVFVSGDFLNGFVVSYNGALSNTNVPILIPISNTLTVDLLVNIVIATPQNGEIPVSAVSEVQHISFNKVPDSGVYVLNFNGSDTANINFSDNATAVKNALELLPSVGIGNLTVTGDYTLGFDITFINTLSGINQPQITVTSTSLNASTAPVVATPCTITNGRLPANNLFNGPTAVTTTVITTDNGSNPEPDWFNGTPIC